MLTIIRLSTDMGKNLQDVKMIVVFVLKYAMKIKDHLCMIEDGRLS